MLYPGAQQATANGNVIPVYVSGTTVSSYSWGTSGITSDANSITGASTYQLSFIWNNKLLSAPHVDAVTLTVTDTNSHIETYTYDFQVPQASVSS